MPLISEYFSQPAGTSNGRSKPSKAEVISLDSSSDSEPSTLAAPNKRRANGSFAAPTPAAKRVKKEHPDAASLDLSQFARKAASTPASTNTNAVAGPSRSKPTSDDSSLPPGSPRATGKTAARSTSNGDASNVTPDEKARQARHEAFVRKLIGPGSRPAGKRSDSGLSQDDDIAPGPPPDLDGDDDDEEEAPRKSKGKGKAKAAATGRKGAAGKSDKITPLEQQVLDLKERYPGVILMIEVGYKLRFFGEDAKIAARELNVACWQDRRFMTAMVPTTGRVQVHIKRLLTAGYKVGLVRQAETAALKKAGSNRTAPFERTLSELYTLSTFVDDLSSADTPAGGTVLCLVEQNKAGKGTDEVVGIGLVAVDPQTGGTIYDDFEDSHMRAELETRLLHLRPTEIVISQDLSKQTHKLLSFTLGIDATNGTSTTGRLERLSSQAKAPPTYEASLSALNRFFAPADKDEDAIDIDGEPEDATATTARLAEIEKLPNRVIMAMSLALKHLQTFHLDALFRRGSLSSFADARTMTLGADALQALDIFATEGSVRGSLFALVDQCKTSFGKRMLRRWVARPLLNLEVLRQRQATVAEIVSSTSWILGKLRGVLGGLPDLERGLARVHYGRASPKELLSLLNAFNRIAEQMTLPENSSQRPFDSEQLNDIVVACPKIQPLIRGFLDQISAKAAREDDKTNLFIDEEDKWPAVADVKSCLDGVQYELDEELKKCAAILKKPSLSFLEVNGEAFLIEVRVADSKRVPASWSRISGTKTATRYRSPRIIELHAEYQQNKERLQAESDKAYLEFLEQVSAQYQDLRDLVSKLATADCLIALASVALLPGFVQPKLVDEPRFEVKAARHPMIEQLRDDPFVPNDMTFGEDGLRTMILSGSNMGGKSCLARTIAVIAILAQIGSHVPADEATIGLFDGVYARMGAEDDLSRGRSTFMHELSSVSDMLSRATSRSLLIFDELGRGTSTFDGLAVALSVLEHVVKKIQSRCAIFITHYPQVSMACNVLEHAQPFHMSYIETERLGQPDITFLYKLKRGPARSSHGLNVARLAGLPQSVLLNAQQHADAIQQTTEQKSRTAQARRIVGATLSATSSASIEEIADTLQDAFSMS